jgi:hypothetical protein
MSIRWRQDGRLLCAAMHPEEEHDTYIDDRLHYELSVVQRAILADADHFENGLWHWVHGYGILRAAPEPVVNDQRSRTEVKNGKEISEGQCNASQGVAKRRRRR